MASERLPRLPSGVGLWTDSGKPTQTMQRWWERVCEEIESARSRMDDIPDLTIYADHTGAALDGELPENVGAKRYFQEVDVTTSSAWSFAVLSGSVTATIGAATGVLNITAVGAAESKVRITSVRGGLTLYKTFTVYRSDAPPPASGSGGGTSDSETSYNSINSTTHATIATLVVTTGSAGQVELSAPLTVKTPRTSPEGVFEVYGKWVRAATSTDVAAEVASDPDTEIAMDPETGEYFLFSGTLTVNATATGLPASTSETFYLQARNASGTRSMTFSGTSSAVGS